MGKNIFRKNVVLGAGIMCCSITSAFALDNKIKISAIVDVQGIHYNNNGTEEQQKLSSKQKKFGFASTGNILVDYALISESGLKYGAKIGLEQTSKNDRGTPLSIYVESDYGKIEAGSNKTTAQNMRITGYKISCAGGNGWDTYINSSPKNGSETLFPYVTNFCSFLDSKARTSRKTDYPRSITYFTPKMGKGDHSVQLGLTYIPDTSNVGHGNIDENNLHTPVTSSQYKFVIKDGISYGVSYEGKFSDLLTANVSFVGERGKPIAFNKSDDSKSNKKFKDLNTYNVGFEVIYDKFSVAGSYMNYNKSLTNSEIDTLGRNTDIYSIGMKYKFLDNKYAASINHFYSDNKKNKLDAFTAGLDCFVATGIKAYTQLTYYKTKGRFIRNNVLEKDSSKGIIAIIGGKVSL